MKKAEVIVAGLGAMGSAAAYHLSKLGVHTVGIDRFHPPHNLGSTHGDTRITRLAIGEGSEYVPLVKRSHQLWRELEEQSGVEIMNQCGGIVIANQGNPFLEQTIQSANQYDIPITVIEQQQLGEQYPMFDLRDNSQACFEPSAGYVRPEMAVAAQLELATQQGAEMFFNQPIISISPDGQGVKVVTEEEQYWADRIIICAGAWAGDFLPPGLLGRDRFSVYRQILYWFPINQNYELFQQMPVFIWEFGASPDDFIYGFPAIDGPNGGIKVATESYQTTSQPDGNTHPPSPQEIQTMYRDYIQPNLPWLGSQPVRNASCWYTSTPDHRFIIDRHPEYEQAIIVSACSGHGFKHSAAIGESVAQLTASGDSKIDLSPFAW